MALTVTNVRKSVVGSMKMAIADVAFDTTYAAGGKTFTPADLDPAEGPNSTFDFVSIQMNDATIADQRFVDYDQANKKLVVKTAVNTEAAAADQSSVMVRLLAFYGGAIR